MKRMLYVMLGTGGIVGGLGLALFTTDAWAGWFSDLLGAGDVANAVANTTIAVTEAQVKLALIAAIKDSTSAILLAITLVGAILCFTAPMYGVMEWMKMVKDFGKNDGKLDRKETVLSMVGGGALLVFGGALIKFGWFLMRAASTGLGELM